MTGRLSLCPLEVQTPAVRRACIHLVALAAAAVAARMAIAGPSLGLPSRRCGCQHRRQASRAAATAVSYTHLRAHETSAHR
eukprot:10049041-Alexandrium_andersonii.AAC.1